MSRAHNEVDLLEIDLGDPPPAKPLTSDDSEIWLPATNQPEPTYELSEIFLDDVHEPSTMRAGDFNIDLPLRIEDAPELEDKFAAPSLTDLHLVEVRALMERPFFALARKPIARLPLYFDRKSGLQLEVTASDPTCGVATLQDADFLIVLTSLMNMKRSSDGRIEPRVTLPAATWLRLGGRQMGGRQHALLKGALDRLADTRITTNIDPTGKLGPMRSFSLLASWCREGRYGLTLTASDWLIEAVEANALLSLAPYYFDLSPGYERWFYRVVRKHAGKETMWKQMFDRTLWKKSGATSSLSSFRSELKRIVAADPLPGYRLAWIAGGCVRDPQVRMRYDPSTVRSKFPKVQRK